jgi:cyclase
MTSSPHDHPRAGTLPPPRVDTVARDVYAYVQPDGGWWVNNAGFVVGNDGVLCVDTCATEARTRAFVEAVDGVVRAQGGGARRGWRVLVSTHQHGDHTNGNCLLPDATIIGHSTCRDAILAMGILRPEGLWEDVDWGALEPAPPFVTFEHRLTVWVDDLRVELQHLGIAAHTTSDVVVWIPERGVLFTGDLVFNGGTPFVLMGSVAGSLVALDRLMELDAEVLVPGHGEPCGIEAVDVVGEYLRFLQTTASEGMRAGWSPLEASRRVDLGPFAGLMHPERLVGNLHRAYAECEGARPGDPLDVVAALADMVTFNGGRPLSCSA